MIHGSDRRIKVLAALTALLSFACGSTPTPVELLDARKAYERASKSQAAQLAPAQLDTAKQALAKAEASFEDEGDEPITKDLSYIAVRRSELAEAEAGREQAARTREKIDHDFRETELDAAEGHKATKQQLEQEKKARMAAEKQAAAAMASLNEIAKVKEESRGMVITLSGSVLFATGKSALLPIAQDKIAEVAKALKDQGFKSILVEGHTDAQGSADKNQVLSLQRAESVRAYLVREGIPSDKIRADGIGSSRPVADNSSAEGRANNRRVEIVVEPYK
jgi:outer membrane protein OmpA-like peptidoglycan-associated protein